MVRFVPIWRSWMRFPSLRSWGGVTAGLLLLGAEAAYGQSPPIIIPRGQQSQLPAVLPASPPPDLPLNLAPSATPPLPPNLPNTPPPMQSWPVPPSNSAPIPTPNTSTTIIGPGIAPPMNGNLTAPIPNTLPSNGLSSSKPLPVPPLPAGQTATAPAAPKMDSFSSFPANRQPTLADVPPVGLKHAPAPAPLPPVVAPPAFGTTLLPISDAQRDYGRFVKNVVDPQATLDLVIGRTRVMQLTDAPTHVQVGDEQIMAFEPLSPTELSFTAKAPGTTTLNLWFVDPADRSRHKILSYLVRVVSDPVGQDHLQGDFKLLADEIKRAFPESQVSLYNVGDKPAVAGIAKNPGQAEQILQIVRAHCPVDKDGVRLNVRAEVSAKDQTGTARAFQTTIELHPGQTIAVTGSVPTAATRRCCCGLCDCPCLSRLFGCGSAPAEQQVTVFITPEMVQSAECGEVHSSLGGDTLRPGDVEFYLLGRWQERRSQEGRGLAPVDPAQAQRLLRCEEIMLAGPQGYSDGRP